MNIIDVVMVLLIIVVVWVESRRGCGRVIFDFVALLVAIQLVSFLAPHVAGEVHFTGDDPANEAIWFALLFVVIGGILLFIGKLAYDMTLISFDSFDSLLGGILGFGAAMIIGHAITKALVISASVGGAPPEALANSILGMEFYQFVTFHRVVDFISSLPK